MEEVRYPIRFLSGNMSSGLGLDGLVAIVEKPDYSAKTIRIYAEYEHTMSDDNSSFHVSDIEFTDSQESFVVYKKTINPKFKIKRGKPNDEPEFLLAPSKVILSRNYH
jgi:hypothetical protein